MFPVTFNAIGDILALAQLLYDIVHTLDDARGAPAEIQRFAHELELLGIVIANVHRVGDASLDDALKEAVLTEARLCYVEIVNAGKLLPGFDSLLQSTVGNSSLGRARLMAKKLQWHFMKASDAAAFATRFHDIYLRLSVLIGSLNHHTIEASLAQVSRQLNGLSAVAEHEHSFTREEMFLSSARLEQLVDVRSRMIIEAIQESRTYSREDTLTLREDVASMAQKFSASSSMQDRVLAERTSSSLLGHLTLSSSPSAPERQQAQRFLSLLIPLAIFGATVVAQANVAPRWRTMALWATICALVIHVIRLQSHLPPSVWSPRDNVIIFVDVLGKKMYVDLQLCTSLEHFNLFLNHYFTTNKLPGQDFVRRGSYELYGSDNPQALTSSSWPQYVSPGVQIEMGVLLRREGLDHSAPVRCPWCDTEALEDASSASYSCMACARSFVTTREFSPINDQSHPSTTSGSGDVETEVAPADASNPESETPASSFEHYPNNGLGTSSIEAREGLLEVNVVQYFVRIRVIEMLVSLQLRENQHGFGSFISAQHSDSLHEANGSVYELDAAVDRTSATPSLHSDNDVRSRTLDTRKAQYSNDTRVTIATTPHPRSIASNHDVTGDTMTPDPAAFVSQRSIEESVDVLRRAETALAVQNLSARVGDWRGHHVSEFGELILDDEFTVTKTNVDREYHVFLFERILLCCKEEIVVSKSKGTRSLKSIFKRLQTPVSPRAPDPPENTRRKTTPLIVKGRIYTNNITKAMEITGPRLYQFRIWWKGEDDIEFFTLNCRNEERLRQWETSVKRLLERLRARRTSERRFT